jgi:hypothetical protein
MQYFFANGNEQRGPYTLEELSSFGLRPDTLVWREGMEQWQRADSIPEVVERIPLASPAAPIEAAPASAHQAVVFAQHPSQPQQQQPLSYRTALGAPSTQPSGMAIASMILGIVSMLALCTVHVGLIAGLPCSILAVVFGFIAKGKANRQEAGGRGMAIAGLVMGFIYLGLWAALLLVGIVAGVIVAMSK